MRDDQTVAGLVMDARNGGRRAWDALVERYAPLIWSICRRHHLGDADAADVGQRVWLQLADQLGRIGDPAALPAWLAATTSRECSRVLHAPRGQHAAGHLLDAQTIPDYQARIPGQELAAAGRHAALLEAFAHLPPCCQQLIAALIQDPRMPDATISAGLGTPAGSIGPAGRRCLDQLRRDPAIAALITAEGQVRPPGQPGPGHRDQGGHLPGPGPAHGTVIAAPAAAGRHRAGPNAAPDDKRGQR